MAAIVAGMLGMSAGSPMPLAPYGAASPSLHTTIGYTSGTSMLDSMMYLLSEGFLIAQVFGSISIFSLMTKPVPMAVPPSIWPSHIFTPTGVPTSCAETHLRSWTSPVSVSTSTSMMQVA